VGGGDMGVVSRAPASRGVAGSVGGGIVGGEEGTANWSGSRDVGVVSRAPPVTDWRGAWGKERRWRREIERGRRFCGWWGGGNGEVVGWSGGSFEGAASRGLAGSLGERGGRRGGRSEDGVGGGWQWFVSVV